MDIVWEYTRIRQLQAFLLVDVIEAIGGDPASFPLRSCLMMDVPGIAVESSPSLTSNEKEIRHWLVAGRQMCFSWDPAKSPLAAYLLDMLGTQGVVDAIEVAKKEAPGSHELLKFLPKEVVVMVSQRLGAVFTDRAAQFNAIPEKLGILAN